MIKKKSVYISENPCPKNFKWGDTDPPATLVACEHGSGQVNVDEMDIFLFAYGLGSIKIFHHESTKDGKHEDGRII